MTNTYVHHENRSLITRSTYAHHASRQIGETQHEQKRKTKVAIFKAILLTFEALLAGPTFARCAFKGTLRRTNLDEGEMDGTHIYIYIYIRRILHSSMISVGLAQARPNNYYFSLLHLY